MTELSSPVARIVAFAAGLAIVFGAAFGVGKAVGPWDNDQQPSHSQMVDHQEEGTHP
ncbi:MAG: hypothetical protein WBG39_11935 [Gordonia sp. (in: high G+C Gram-positive bacteria)]